MSDQTLNTQKQPVEETKERNTDKAHTAPAAIDQRTMKGAAATATLTTIATMSQHMGLTGLVLSGVVSYVVWRHGPEITELVNRETGIKDLAARLPHSAKKTRGNGERTFWQKAWNIQPTATAATVIEEAEPPIPTFETPPVEEAQPEMPPSEIFTEEVTADQTPPMRRITLEEAAQHLLERFGMNSYKVYTGRSLMDEIGRARLIDFQEKHMKFIGASQRGKSSMITALLTLIAMTHDPQYVEFAILDFENTSGRVLAHLPHIKTISVHKKPVRLHATKKAQVLEYLIHLQHYMEYRYSLSPKQRANLPLLIIYIEEFLRLRKEYANKVKAATPGAARERAQRDYALLCDAIEALTTRGLKARMQLWLAGQVDYADRNSTDVRDALTNVTEGMSFGVKQSTAQAAGFTLIDEIKTNWRKKQKGVCVIETSDCQDLVLALDFDLKARVAALDDYSTVQGEEENPPLPLFQHETGPLGHKDEENMDELDILPLPELPLRFPVPGQGQAGKISVAMAYRAYEDGAKSIRAIERELDIPYNQARDLWMEMQRDGLIPRKASGESD